MRHIKTVVNKYEIKAGLKITIIIGNEVIKEYIEYKMCIGLETTAGIPQL